MEFVTVGRSMSSLFRATILVVGSDTRELETLREHLERAEYKVLSACDAEEALRILQKSLRPIDMVIAEMKLPTMTGEALGCEVQKLHARTPVVLVSDDAAASACAIFFTFTRPFRPQVLVQYVNAALEANAGEPIPAQAQSATGRKSA